MIITRGDPARSTPPLPLPVVGKTPLRVRGLDLARGIAVLGMFAAHVGPAPDAPTGRLLSIFHGRSAALFLFLAGPSLALISGGPRRADGPTLHRSRIKIATRAGVLLVLGLSLTSLVAGIDVILPVSTPYSSCWPCHCCACAHER